MARRRRKSKKVDPFTELIAPVLLLFLVLFVMQYQITGSVDFSMFEASAPLYKLIAVFLLLIFFGVVVAALFSRFKEKVRRDFLVRKQSYLNDWFSMDPNTFEHFVAGVYEKRGYKVAEVTQYVADHGIDVVLEKGSKRYAIQVKQYKNKAIGEKDLREFYGSYSDDFDGGTFLTTSYFTRPARAWAKKKGMLLVDNDYLVKMMEEFEERQV